MSQDIPECCICFEGINDSSRRPRSLPCGHSICTMCIEKTIEKGDRTCPSCRQPHHVATASKLPINYAVEEVFKKSSVKKRKINNEQHEDFRKKKKSIISETRDFIHSFETTALEIQNKLSVKETLIENHQAQIEQKLTEVECLKKDIQEEMKEKKGFEGTLTELEDKITYLENSVKNLRSSKTTSDVLNIHEDVKRKLKVSTLQQDSASNKIAMSNNLQDSHPSSEDPLNRIVKLVKTSDVLGFSIMQNFANQIHICSITTGSAADNHGGLKCDDRILRINGQSLEGRRLADAAMLLRDAVGDVTLEVRLENTSGLLYGYSVTHL